MPGAFGLVSRSQLGSQSSVCSDAAALSSGCDTGREEEEPRAGARLIVLASGSARRWQPDAPDDPDAPPALVLPQS